MTPAQLGLKFVDLGNELNNSNIVTYYSYMVHIAVLFGADQERAINELKDSLNFEIALATVSNCPINTVLFLKYNIAFLTIFHSRSPYFPQKAAEIQRIRLILPTPLTNSCGK